MKELQFFLTDKFNNKPGDILPDLTHRPKGNIFGKYEIRWSGVNPQHDRLPGESVITSHEDWKRRRRDS